MISKVSSILSGVVVFQLLHSFGNPHGFGFITNRRNLRIFIFVEQAPIRERACPVWSPRPVLSKSWCLLPEWEMRMPFKKSFVPKAAPFPWHPYFYLKRGPKLFSGSIICRTLDDWADEGHGEKLREARQCWSEHRPHELLDHYRFLQARWGLDSLPLTELMDAMLREQEGVRIKSEAELLEYCHGVAGTIGLMTCPIFGVTEPDALQHADDLGIAMQLTNICRDVREDAENDRIYLPADFFTTSPSVSDLLSKDSKWIEETVLVKRRLLSLAEERYASGEAGIRYLPFRMRIVVLGGQNVS